MFVPTRGRRVAAAAIAAGLLSLAGATWAAGPRLVERWHLWRLQSVDPRTRVAAIEALGRWGTSVSRPVLKTLLRSASQDEACAALGALLRGHDAGRRERAYCCVEYPSLAGKSRAEIAELFGEPLWNRSQGDIGGIGKPPPHEECWGYPASLSLLAIFFTADRCVLAVYTWSDF